VLENLIIASMSLKERRERGGASGRRALAKVGLSDKREARPSSL
jgi:ABC-type polar amino acid transport system ATPase subunit